MKKMLWDLFLIAVGIIILDLILPAALFSAELGIVGTMACLFILELERWDYSLPTVTSDEDESVDTP